MQKEAALRFEEALVTPGLQEAAAKQLDSVLPVGVVARAG